MKVFRKGGPVKIIADTSGHGLKIGRTVLVLWTNRREKRYKVFATNKSHFVNFDEVEAK